MMESLVVFLSIAGLALGANTACLTVDEIVDAIFLEADTDMDNNLSMQEFSATLSNNWGITLVFSPLVDFTTFMFMYTDKMDDEGDKFDVLANDLRNKDVKTFFLRVHSALFITGGAGLSISEFTNLWVIHYHDSHPTAHDFAVNLDINNDKRITDVDMNMYAGIYDANPMDGQFSKEEFLTFMHAVHPDPHNAGGHGCH